MWGAVFYGDVLVSDIHLDLETEDKFHSCIF